MGEDVLFGRYQRGILIGRGASGEVYEARRTDASDARVVALKMPAARAERLVLAREAEVSARVSHPRVLDAIDTIRGTDGDVVALVMPMLRGRQLSALAAERGKLPWRWVVGCLVQVLDGVEAIHAAGYLHGDIKPGNVMVLGEAPLDAEPNTVLFDLGSATPRGSSRGERDGDYRLTTTAAYAPPELYGVGERGAASDLYSVAVIAFELLCGIRPFTGDTDEEVAYKHIHHQPPRLERVDASADIPPHVVLAVHRGLAKDPEDRFSTARAFAGALEGEKQPTTLTW